MWLLLMWVVVAIRAFGGGGRGYSEVTVILIVECNGE